VTAALGGTVTVLAAMSVVALRWHYPTDALAGVAVGGGVVLVADCVARAVATRVARARASEREPRPDAEQTLSH
jgi:membrane-associated phospholipid phosphatase